MFRVSDGLVGCMKSQARVQSWLLQRSDSCYMVHASMPRTTRPARHRALVATSNAAAAVALLSSRHVQAACMQYHAVLHKPVGHCMSSASGFSMKRAVVRSPQLCFFLIAVSAPFARMASDLLFYWLDGMELWSEGLPPTLCLLSGSWQLH
jgi:hypothetical protein